MSMVSFDSGSVVPFEQSSANFSRENEVQKCILKEKKLPFWLSAMTAEAWEERCVLMEKNNTINISELKIPNIMTHIFVQADEGKISEVTDPYMLAFEQLDKDVAILVQAYNPKGKQPIYSALHRVKKEPIYLIKTLQDLIGKVQRGTLRIFMTGNPLKPQYHHFGALKTDSEKEYIADSIHSIIDNFKENNKEIKIYTVDTTFNICSNDSTIAYGGFDSQLRPFQILDLTEQRKADLERFYRHKAKENHS